MLDLTRAMSVGCLLSCLVIPWNLNPATVCDFLGVDVLKMVPYMSIAPIVTGLILLTMVGTGLDKRFSRIAREGYTLPED